MPYTRTHTATYNLAASSLPPTLSSPKRSHTKCKLLNEKKTNKYVPFFVSFVRSPPLLPPHEDEAYSRNITGFIFQISK